MSQPLPQDNRSVAALIEEGRARLLTADRAGALKLLERAVALEPRNEQAWLNLAAAVDTSAERRLCLQRALAINPANEMVRRELALTQPLAGPAETQPVTAPLPQAAEPATEWSTRRLDAAVPQSWSGVERGAERQPTPETAGLAPLPSGSAGEPPAPALRDIRRPAARPLFRSVPAALYALIFMTFFLPFVTISCGSMRESYSGVALMSSAIEFEGAGWLSEQTGYDLDVARGASARAPAIAALVAAVIGVAAALVPHWIGRAVAPAAGLAGLAALLLLRSGIERQISRPPLDGFVVVSYEGGYWAGLLLFALGVAASLIILLIELSARRRSR